MTCPPAPSIRVIIRVLMIQLSIINIIIRVLMVQLSIISPQHILPIFARLKFFYAKCPFIGDFYHFLKIFRHHLSWNVNGVMLECKYGT